jgi:glycyl-tRNA synthetase
MGWSELEGIANRTDFDLKAHSRSPENPDSVSELRYFDQEQKKHIVPYVIEPSAGADRATLAFLCDAYDESLVTEPAAEEIAKLREQVGSFARSVDKRAPSRWSKDKAALAAAETIIRACRALPQLLRAQRSRAPTDRGLQEGAGIAEKLGDEHAHRARLHPRLAPIRRGGPAQEQARARQGRPRDLRRPAAAVDDHVRLR